MNLIYIFKINMILFHIQAKKCTIKILFNSNELRFYLGSDYFIIGSTANFL